MKNIFTAPIIYAQEGKLDHISTLAVAIFYTWILTLKKKKGAITPSVSLYLFTNIKK